MDAAESGLELQQCGPDRRDKPQALQGSKRRIRVMFDAAEYGTYIKTVPNPIAGRSSHSANRQAIVTNYFSSN